MKKHFLLWPLLALAAPAAAQHVEIQGRAGVGLSRFGGADAQATSFVNAFDTPDTGYTNSPYGSHWGAGVALGIRAERVGAHHGLLAFDLGYEWLQSRTNITELSVVTNIFGSPTYRNSFGADGSTALQTHNLTAFLGLGHRLAAGKLNVDVLAGPEVAYVFGFREKGSGTYAGTASWSTDLDHRAQNRADARLRADATVWYQRLGFNASYSHGFLNYQGSLLGGSREVYARVLRLGLVYRLR